MALRIPTYRVVQTLCLVVILHGGLISTVLAKDRSITTNLGRLVLPESWNVEQVSDSQITAWSREDGSRLNLYLRAFEPLKEYLHKRADELRISRYVRSVSKEFLDEANADKGGFILGLNPLADEDAPVLSQEEWVDLDWTNLSGIPSSYLYVVAYERNRKLYVLEATAATESADEIKLSDIHRSWQLP